MVVRRMACEALTFMCYCEPPAGHTMVLRGLALLQDGNAGRFDAWFDSFEQMIDGRGRMGSLVGASKDVRSLGVSGHGDTHLMEFAVSYLYLPSVPQLCIQQVADVSPSWRTCS